MNRSTITAIILGVAAAAAISAFAGYTLLRGEEVQDATSQSCDFAGADVPADIYVGAHDQGDFQNETTETGEVRCD